MVDALIPQRIERNPLAPPLSCETDQWIRRLLAGGICIYIHPPPHPLCISLPLIHTHTRFESANHLHFVNIIKMETYRGNMQATFNYFFFSKKRKVLYYSLFTTVLVVVEEISIFAEIVVGCHINEMDSLFA